MLNDPKRRAHQPVFVDEFMEQEDEFIPAHPRNQIVCAHLFGKHLCHFFEHRIPRRMAQRVIDRFEIIEIEMHERKGRSAAEHPREDLIHRPPIAKPGQRIGKGLFFGGNLRPLQALIELLGLLKHR